MIDHIGLCVSDYQRSKAFYTAALVPLSCDAAIRAGATDNGPPGLRPEYHPNYYGAFVMDTEGHNLEAVCQDPQ